MTRIFYFIVTFLMIPMNVFSADFISAEHYFQKGQYSQAQHAYTEILSKNPNSLSAHYNLGNVYYRENNIGGAVCHYLKALKISPRDTDTQFNLGLARAKIIDELHSKQAFGPTKWLEYVAVKEVVGVFLIFLTLSNIFWGMAMFFKREEISAVLGLSIVLCLVSGAILMAKVWSEQRQVKGVIMTEKVAVKSGPSRDLGTVFFLHSGAEFKIDKESQGWIEISLNKTFKGWVNENDICRI